MLFCLKVHSHKVFTWLTETSQPFQYGVMLLSE